MAGDTQHALLAVARPWALPGSHGSAAQTSASRMYDAMQRGLAQYTSVILVGSDCPGIDPAYLQAGGDARCILHRSYWGRPPMAAMC